MNLCDCHILSWITFMPLIGAAGVALLGKQNDRGIKFIALLASLASLAMTLSVWSRFDPTAGIAFEDQRAWIPILNVQYHLGVDGLSITMLLLTAIITPLAMLAHWKQERDTKLFFFLFLLLETGMLGVFTALNFFHWFIFWELSLIPAFFLIKLWGGPQRTTAATQFFIYTMVGSIALLLSFLAIYQAVASV